MSAGDSTRRQRHAIGYHPVRELLRSQPHLATEILVAERRSGARRREIESLARRHDIALREVSRDELDDLAQDAQHNGFAVSYRPPDEEGERASSGLIVLLEDVQDPRNLGAILRVCEATGVERVLIRDRGSAPLNVSAEKASAGASSWVEVERVVNTAQEISRLKDDGFWIYGADEGGEAPWSMDLTGKVVLCLGGEEKGLRQRTRGLVDGLVGLPMHGRIASLNVATAASALLYEIVRQREVR